MFTSLDLSLYKLLYVAIFDIEVHTYFIPLLYRTSSIDLIWLLLSYIDIISCIKNTFKNTVSTCVIPNLCIITFVSMMLEHEILMNKIVAKVDRKLKIVDLLKIFCFVLLLISILSHLVSQKALEYYWISCNYY